MLRDSDFRKTKISVHHKNWKVGGYYYRGQGTKCFKINSIERHHVYSDDTVIYKADYLDGTTDITDQKRNLILAERVIKSKGEKEMDTLYKVIGQEIYGTHIATNKEGKFVLDLKGGGVAAYDKKEIEEVIPYSVKCSDEYHYQVREGTLKVGDLVYADGAVMLVKEIDTKSKHTNNAEVLKIPVFKTTEEAVS